MKVSINKANLIQLLENNRKVMVIDVRSNDEYQKQHLPDAINIPIEIIEAGHFVPESDKQIITVCGKGGGRSMLAANYLRENFPNETLFLEGGTLGWFES